jgi:transcriptional regulator
MCDLITSATLRRAAPDGVARSGRAAAGGARDGDDGAVLIHPWDAAHSPREWRAFLRAQGFGHLVAAGRGRDVPVVVPTQYVVDDETVGGDAERGGEILLHLARPNPIWSAIEENPHVVLSVAGDWAYVPSGWKAVGDEDPAFGIPTTYYAAVQVVGEARVVDDPDGKLRVLRRQLGTLQPDGGHVDPAEHHRRLAGIRGLRLPIGGLGPVTAKFKYGGNVDRDHREAAGRRLAERGGPGDRAAREHLLRRLDTEPRA